MEKQNPDIVAVWGATCTHLQEHLSKDIYDTWIADLEPITLSDEALTLGVSNGFYLDWLKNNYLDLIKQAVQVVLAAPCEIKLEVFEPSNDATDVPTPAIPKRKPITLEEPTPSPRPSKKKAEAPKLNPKYTFDSFVVGSSNNFAHAASLAAAQNPAKSYNPLFIFGGVGLGKTHLMQAIGHHIYQDRGSKVCYVTSESLLNDYVNALRTNHLVDFRKHYRSADVLLIDDIHFLGGKEQIQEEFFHTFNALYDNHRQIVMTSDRTAQEIPDLEERLVSRFEWGLVTELATPNVETRLAILRNIVDQLNIHISDEALSFIADHVSANIRKLEGALTRAASYASLTGEHLTIEVLERLLKDYIDCYGTPASLSLDEIIRTVAEHYNLGYNDMIGRRRTKTIALPRQVAMYLCRELTDHSLPTIGEAFGKNHATVLYACRTLGKKQEADPQFRMLMGSLKQKLSLD